MHALARCCENPRVLCSFPFGRHSVTLAVLCVGCIDFQGFHGSTQAGSALRSAMGFMCCASALCNPYCMRECTLLSEKAPLKPGCTYTLPLLKFYGGLLVQGMQLFGCGLAVLVLVWLLKVALLRYSILCS